MRGKWRDISCMKRAHNITIRVVVFIGIDLSLLTRLFSQP